MNTAWNVLGMFLVFAFGCAALDRFTATAKADEPRAHSIHWVCPPMTRMMEFACFAYRDDTGEVLSIKKIVLSSDRKGEFFEGLPVGTRP